MKRVVLSGVAAAAVLLGAVAAQASGRFVVFFSTGSTEISPDAKSTIAVIEGQLTAKHVSAIKVVGHCSAHDVEKSGNPSDSGVSLSTARAQAVVDALHAAGLPETVKVAVSGKPAVKNDDPRRRSVSIIAK